MDENFFYLLSDYDGKRRNTTSFQNDFIDNLIRTISPKLTIKLIDACQSGESYIKSNETVKAYFKSTAGKLANCYFLSSSQSDQSSWLRKYSSFTQAFLEAIKESQTNEVRYLSIIDYITDFFERNPEQTPFYITQGSFTEKFCHISDELKKYLESILGASVLSTGKKGTYIDIILEEGKKFLTKEDVEKCIEETRDIIKEFELQSELNQIYEIEKQFIADKSDYDMDYKPIGIWLSKTTDIYFAKPEFGVKSVQIKDADNKFSVRRMKIVNGYSNTVDLSLEGVALVFNPKVGNIASYDLTYMFVVSKTEIRLFKSFAPFIETGWDNKQLSKDLKWRTILLNKDDLVNLKSFW